MNKFSKSSLEHLLTCHSDLQKIAIRALNLYDFTIICGSRSEEDQNKAFTEGKSKLKYPDSKHNKHPSEAFDACPYPIDWNDTERFKTMAKIILDVAKEAGIKLRWGGDWNMDGTPSKFVDLPHFELV